MKRKGGRQPARYEREQATRKRDAAKAVKLEEAAAARSYKIWRKRGEEICAAAERERRAASEKYWATVDPKLRLRQVRPFALSPQLGVTKDVLRRMEEIKLATLGYLESTIILADDGRNHLSEGPLGAVASQEDAKRLVAALTAAFPHIPFRFELMEELLENVEWRRIDEVASDSGP